MLKLEIGGGVRSLGGDWINIDLCPTADVQHDITKTPWPFESNSVDEVYTSHCLEHMCDIRPMLLEIARITKLGAHVEIRIPHWLHDCALMGFGFGYNSHLHSYGPQFWWRVCNEAKCGQWWGDGDKRLFATSTHYEPEQTIDEARLLFPQMTDDQIMRLIPGTSHEVRYHFEVVLRDDPRSTERAI